MEKKAMIRPVNNTSPGLWAWSVVAVYQLRECLCMCMCECVCVGMYVWVGLCVCFEFL